MTENNKFEKSFGPAGSFAGMIVFAAGLILLFFHFSGLILVLIGAFAGFSGTSTIIDYDRKRVRFSNNLFGILPIGRWIQIEPDMKVAIRESNVIWRAYSQGNRSLDMPHHDLKIVLLNSDNKEIIPLKKVSSREKTTIELETIGKDLGLGLY